MSRIFWDTNLFIYLLEDYKDLSPQALRAILSDFDKQVAGAEAEFAQTP